MSAAAVLAEKLRHASGLLASTGGTNSGAVDRYLGLLAMTLSRFEEAESYFRAAAQLHERIGAPLWFARTCLDWGGLVSRGRPSETERARQLLDQARRIARDLGSPPVGDRAVLALASTRK